MGHQEKRLAAHKTKTDSMTQSVPATHMQIVAAEQFDDLPQEYEASKLGMWTFLATEVLFFGVLFASYTIARLLHAQGFAEANHHTDLTFGSIETGILLTSSMTMAFAVRAARLGRHRRAAGLVTVTLLLGVAFITLHLLGYHHHYQEGLVPGANFAYQGPRRSEVELFFFLYFAMTGFHMLHVTAGVLVLIVIAVMAWRRTFGPPYFTPIELTALYWDFVDIVWIFLFPSFYLVSRG
jgi:cytochrome c oxidase subunit 3